MNLVSKNKNWKKYIAYISIFILIIGLIYVYHIFTESVNSANISAADSGAKQVYSTAQTIIDEMESKGIELPVGYIDNTTAADYKDIYGTGDNSVTFQSEMIIKYPELENTRWGVYIEMSSTKGIIRGMVLSSAYSENPHYIGTYPAVPENEKGYFKDISSAVDFAKQNSNSYK